MNEREAASKLRIVDVKNAPGVRPPGDSESGTWFASSGSVNSNDEEEIMRHLPKAGNKSAGKVENRDRRATRAAIEDRSTRADRNEYQTSSKIGVESGSKKEDKLRYKTDLAPASTPVPGAFGKNGYLSETEDEMVHPDEDEESGRRDFMAERHRQNRRAKK